VNLGIGCLFAYHKKLLFSVLTGLLLLGGGISVFQMLGVELQEYYSFIKLGSFFLFYSLVSLEIIKQVAKAKTIKRNVILGLMSGYISLGFLAFFLFLTIEIIEPDSFSGLIIAGVENPNIKEQLFYFSYVTLLTIGYG
jgi:voltage-gated potassium channel